MSEVERETKRILCSTCRVITHHHLRARYSRVLQVVLDETGEAHMVDDVVGFDGKYDTGKYDTVATDYQVRTSICSCAGCDEETFELQRLSKNTNGELEEEWRTYYPERSASIQPKYFQNLAPKLRQVYSEAIACFNRGSLLLFTIGLRALLEGICRDKGLVDGNLEHKVDGLIKFLPSVNVIQALHNFRITGNNAAHELDPLSREDAEMAIGIIEDLLNFLYDLDYKASQLRVAANKTVPKSGLVH